ncbi:hypothetical protein LTR08_001997 [Meristemomyces frigidus]|nr:hypothetical protein LTR08_001997 [Meristemomyces frigidus]
MPLPGDQHKDTPATANPFIDTRPAVSQYTAQEIATLQSRLERQLGPEYISTRPGAGGGKVHYLAAEKVINLANEVFGFNGWSSAIQNVQIDFVDENPANGKITLGLSTIVRVSLRDGTFHEDIGYGHIENCKGKAAAFEKAKKEAATDAMKRALRNFGNVLGNCLYDKEYLNRVTKVKIAPSKWDAENLHRHHDFAPMKRESIADVEAQQDKSAAVRRQSSAQSGGSFGSAEFEDDFGGSLLNEEDFTHPDEVRMDDSTLTAIESPAHRAINGPQNGAQRQGVARMHSMPHLRPPNVQAPAQIQSLQTPQRPQAVQRPSNTSVPPPQGNRMLPLQRENGAAFQNGAPQQQHNAAHQNSAPQQHNQPQRPNGPPYAQNQVPLQRPNQPPQRVQQQSAVQQQQQQHIPSDPSNSRSNPSSATTVADSPSNANAAHGPNTHNNNTHTHNLNTTNPTRPAPPADHLSDDPSKPHQQPRMPPPDAPSGFVTGRSADLLNQPVDARPPNANLAFNPHADSPSIRRTQGVNPGKSAPISRANLTSAVPPPGGAAPTTTTITTPSRPTTANFVNPSLDTSRRIGAPGFSGGGGGGGGMGNRGQYKPPTSVGVKRPALADVSNVGNANGGQGFDGAGEAKKARLEGE